MPGPSGRRAAPGTHCGRESESSWWGGPFCLVSLRTCPLLIAPRKESQAIDHVQSVRPARGDPQLLEGVSRALREGCDRPLVLALRDPGELGPRRGSPRV